jgi:hypothetical protein
LNGDNLSASSLLMSPLPSTPPPPISSPHLHPFLHLGLSSSSPSPLLPCGFCTMKFGSLSSLHKHVISVHSSSFGSLYGFHPHHLHSQAHLQQQQQQQLLILQQRQAAIKSKESVFCAQCAVAFPNSTAYAEHVLTSHVDRNDLVNHHQQNDDDDDRSRDRDQTIRQVNIICSLNVPRNCSVF